MKLNRISLPPAHNDKSIEVSEIPLLKKVHDVHERRLEDQKAKLQEGFESGEEVELRFDVNYEAAEIQCIEDIDAFKDRLLLIPGSYARVIEQVNVDADQERAYRLRKTSIIVPEGAEEQNWYRVALKSPTENEGAKEETQLILKPNDPRAIRDREIFNKLFENNGIRRHIRTRVYIPVADGEIHVEIYNSPDKEPDLTDIIRIEREFQGDNKIANAKYVRNNLNPKTLLFPWIGRHVTDDPAWRNKSLTKKGPPKSAILRREKLRAESRKRRQEEEKRKKK